MYTYTFLILIDLSKVSIQDRNYKALLDIFGSNIFSLEYNFKPSNIDASKNK